MNLSRLLLAGFALGFAFVLLVMALPVYVRDAAKRFTFSRLIDWFFRDVLPVLLLLVGACATLVLFWVLDYLGYNNVSR